MAAPARTRELMVGITAAAAVVVVSALSGTSGAALAAETAARAITVGLPVAVGLYAMRRPPFERFGAQLLLLGALAVLSALSTSDLALPYSTGRVANWMITGAVLCLMLAFPTGRWAERPDRVLGRAAALLVLVLYLPTAPFVAHYPTPGQWTTCDTDCPENAFMAVAHEPAVIGALVIPARELATIVLLTLVIARLAQRIRRATPLRRRSLTPVLTVSIAWGASLGFALLIRRAWPHSPTAQAAAWAVAFAVPAMALGFLVGVVRWWVYVGASLRRLSARLRAPVDPSELRDALADAFEDPSLEVVYRVDDGWVDGAGRRVAAPGPGSARCLSEVGDRDRVVGALIHDAALEHEPAFIDAAASYAALTFENHRVAANAELLRRELDASRARLAASAGDERRRIERDLHDGAQQRLISLGIRLGLAAEQAGQDAVTLRALSDEVQAVLDEVRAIARGNVPPILTERGLAAALALPAADAPITTRVVTGPLRRYPAEVEKCVYLCCLEGLQNACKHAGPGATVHITITEDGATVCFEVRDDGTGFDLDRISAGAGLANVRQRVAALGGRLKVESTPGRGTRVFADIPV